jgi:Xaa-Pro aminopeptidase
MFAPSTYNHRRAQLAQSMGNGKLLFLGNEESPMNYGGNTYPFRQDSNFLYFFGIDRAGLAAVLDAATGEATIFGDELTMDDIVWTGPLPSIAEQAAQSGVTKTAPFAALADALQGEVHFLPPYRSKNAIRIHQLLQIPIAEVKARASLKFIKAIIQLRQYKTEEEIAQIETAVQITNQMHIQAMLTARPGMTEAQVHAAVAGVALSHHTVHSFNAIISVDGQILHNHSHKNQMKPGQLLLVDAGAESHMHYAGDMTRTFPVSGRFSERQKGVYQAVLDGQMAAIGALKPGTTYRECHLIAARKIAEGMKEMGLMRGNMDEAVAAGAHAMFYQHGLGHMMGLDVHDMEDLGEQHVGYGDDMQRSSQFGLGFLRMARKLEAGFVVTVEPGIYFIPQLIDQWKAEGRHKNFINFDALEHFKDFGGIRIEDDYLITQDGARLLGGNVPKSIAEVEALRGGIA